jgi:hypothetical protein
MSTGRCGDSPNGYLLAYFTLTVEYHAAPFPHNNGKHPDGSIFSKFAIIVRVVLKRGFLVDVVP